MRSSTHLLLLLLVRLLLQVHGCRDELPRRSLLGGLAHWESSGTVGAGGLRPRADTCPPPTPIAVGLGPPPCPSTPTWCHVSRAQADAALLPVLPGQPGAATQGWLPPDTGGQVDIVLEILLLRGRGVLSGVSLGLHPSKHGWVPTTYLDAWHVESHRLEGALPKAQRPGEFHLPHLARRFGQEDEALMGWRREGALPWGWGWGAGTSSTVPAGPPFTLWGSLEVKLLHSRK